MSRIPSLRAVSGVLASLFAVALIAPLASAQVEPTPSPNPVPAPSPSPTPDAKPTPAPQDPRQSDTPGQAAPKTAGTPLPGGTPTTTPTGPPPPKTIEELTKGYDKIDGLFTLYRKVENNRQKLLAEVKESQIGPLFVLQSTYASGNAGRVVAGRPQRDLVWRFKRTPDDRLILAAPNLWFRAHDPNLRNAVERDFPDAYLDIFNIQATSKDKKTVLIDFSGLFDGSVTGLDSQLEAAGPQRGLVDGYAIDPEMSFLEKIKNFPTNLVIDANYTYRRVGPPGTAPTNGAQSDPRSLPIKVTFNLYGLAPNDYQPRLADPRVGFFLNGQLSSGKSGFQSFDDDAASDPRVILINRWNLKKADPAAAVSAPVKPITFYLDTSIPAAYRDAVRQGILSWNKAFLPIGFKNAIEVKDAPLNDWDTADMRYSTVRWVASPPSSGSAYAVALLRENPITGEIINAGINVNANFARVAYSQKQEVVNPLDDVRKARSPEVLAGIACEMDDEWRVNAERGHDIAEMMGVPIDNKTYVNDLLREIVAHEFGHILGLRHNFAASTFLTPQQLSDPKVVRQWGTSASLMDYVGFNDFGLKSGAPLFQSGPGKYDMWAISYGYTPLNAATADAEKPALNKIAGRSNEPGLLFQSDELADDFDPTIVRYDLSSDPLTYVEKSFDENRELMRTLGARKPKPGETYSQFTRRLRGLIRVNAGDAEKATRYVGGIINRRAVRGDKGEKQPFTPVPLAQQRRALDILARRVFAPNAFAIPAAYLTKTEPDPYDFEDAGADQAFPLREDIARVRAGVLMDLFDPNRLSRMANTTWKFPTQTLGFPELFSRARQMVWGDLSKSPSFTAEQRDTARQHLRILITLATDKVPAPADARLVAFGELQTLKGQLAGPRKNAPDEFSRLFFADTIRRIDAALAKKPE